MRARILGVHPSSSFLMYFPSKSVSSLTKVSIRFRFPERIRTRVAKFLSEVGKKTDLVARFSTVGGEKGSADAERDPRGFAVKFYTEEGNYDMVGNNTPVFFIRDTASVLQIRARVLLKHKNRKVNRRARVLNTTDNNVAAMILCLVLEEKIIS